MHNKNQIEKRRIEKFNHPFPVGSNNSNTLTSTTTGCSKEKWRNKKKEIILQIEWKSSKEQDMILKAIRYKFYYSLLFCIQHAFFYHRFMFFLYITGVTWWMMIEILIVLSIFTTEICFKALHQTTPNIIILRNKFSFFHFYALILYLILVFPLLFTNFSVVVSLFYSSFLS